MRIIGQANSKMFTVNKDTKLTKLNTEKNYSEKWWFRRQMAFTQLNTAILKKLIKAEWPMLTLARAQS